MLTPEMAGEKLRDLKIFTPPGVVMGIVLHLKSGGKQNALYLADPPVASNKTVLKIKKLLDAGELDWMTDELAELNLLLDETEKASAEDLAKNIEEMARKGWTRYQDDGDGELRLRITEEVEEPLRDYWGWSITNLEVIGIPATDALGILQEFDGLVMARKSSEVTISTAAKIEIVDSHGFVDGISSKPNDRTFLRKFRGFERYLYLNHLVYLMYKYPNPEYNHYCTATALYTRGVIADDDAMKTAGEDILRYEIFRGGKYLDAYVESLKRYKRTPKRNRELRDQIDALLKGNYKTNIKVHWNLSTQDWDTGTKE